MDVHQISAVNTSERAHQEELSIKERSEILMKFIESAYRGGVSTELNGREAQPFLR